MQEEFAELAQPAQMSKSQMGGMGGNYRSASVAGR